MSLELMLSPNAGSMLLICANPRMTEIDQSDITTGYHLYVKEWVLHLLHESTRGEVALDDQVAHLFQK